MLSKRDESILGNNDDYVICLSFSRMFWGKELENPRGQPVSLIQSILALMMLGRQGGRDEVTKETAAVSGQPHLFDGQMPLCG